MNYYWLFIDDCGLDRWWIITDNTIHMLFVINNDQSRWLLFMIVPPGMGDQYWLPEPANNLLVLN